jgi:glycosyltransferase involved in cell wall biosynthesis
MSASGFSRRIAVGVVRHLTGRNIAASRAHARLNELAARHPRFLIAIPFLKFGGAERVAANLAAALRQLHGPGSVAILVTDWSRLLVRVAFPEDASIRSWFPPDVPLVDIVAMRSMQWYERAIALRIALASARPEMIINVNSQTMWELYEHFGQELARHTRLATIGFVHALDQSGKPYGYTKTHLRKVLPFLDRVITDNEAVIDVLRRDLRLREQDAAKFTCLYQTAPPVRPRPARTRSQRRPQILWASRVTRSKCPELVPAVARLLSECDIHAYGARELGYRFPAVKSLLFPHHDLGHRLTKARNLRWRGAFKQFGDLPLARFDALLYTGLYDGLPNILLEAGAAGLPIVAPNVGGIGELIDDTTGWLVKNPLDATEYADCLAAAIGPEGHRRVAALQFRIAMRHSFEGYCKAVTAILDEAPPLAQSHG